MINTSPALQQAAMLGALAGRQPTSALSALLQTDTAARTVQAERGIRVYQANAAALAQRTLTSTFPVLAQLIGEENMEPLARHFWQHHPPVRGDMGEWGELLAEFIEASAQLANEPFLGDVTRVEWALHRAASAADAELDVASFGMLSETSGEPASLALSPGTVTLASAFPIASIVNAHVSGVPTLNAAAELLSSQHSEHALVWRQGFKPRVRASSAAECALVNALLHRHPLGAALGLALVCDPRFDFNSWLSQAVQTGLVVCAFRFPTELVTR